MALLQRASPPKSPQQSQPAVYQDKETETNYFSHVISSSNPSHTKIRLQANIHTLHELVQPCAEEEVLKAALVHVKAAVSVLQSMGKFPRSTLQAKHLYPPNMNCEKQRKFLSTKKKRESSATTMRKPSLDDIKRCKNTLQKYEPQCCGVCLQEEDKATTKVVEWTQCASCGLWLHTTCSNSSVSFAISVYRLTRTTCVTSNKCTDRIVYLLSVIRFHTSYALHFSIQLAIKLFLYL